MLRSSQGNIMFILQKVRTIALCSAPLLWAGPGLADTTNDLRFETRQTTELSSGNQYYVTTDCFFSKNLSIADYMRRLDRKGRYLTRRAVPPTRQAVHLITFTDAPEVTVDNAFTTVETTDAGFTKPLLVFAQDDASNDPVSFDSRTICDRGFFLINRNALYGAASLYSSTKKTGADFAASLLTFLSSAGDALSEIALGKDLGTSATEDLQRATTAVDSFKTFSDAFAGDSENTIFMKFQLGDNFIRTSYSTVRVRIRDVDDFLTAKGIPFRDNAAALSPIAAPTDDFKTLAEQVDMQEAARTSLRRLCKAHDIKLRQSGYHAAADRAYFLAMHLRNAGASKSGLIRCFLDTKLDAHMADRDVRRLIATRLGGDAVYTTVERDRFISRVKPWDHGKNSGIPKKIAKPKPDAQSFDITEGAFFQHFSTFLDPQQPSDTLTPEQKGFLEALEANFRVEDQAGILQGEEAATTPFAPFAQLSSKGFNRYGCILRRDILKTQEAARVGLGLDDFGTADFLMLAFDAPRPTWANRNQKVISPENALVIRGYLDPDSGKIALFQTTLKNAEPVFAIHSGCQSRRKPKADAVGETADAG
jgi:hypothetical protein